MFTGIVEAIGAVENINPSTSGTTLTIATPPPSPILSDVHLGDSISINGTCLTVTSFTDTSFTVGLSPETLRRTTLSGLRPRLPVNLERAVSANTRMGGHFVQGHVDCVAEIVDKRRDGEAVVYRLRPMPVQVEDGQTAPGAGEMMRWVVEKGYITLDGASLTVTKVADIDEPEPWWEVMLVAYTQEKIVMGKKNLKATVNVEVDMVGKYVERSVRAYFDEMLRDGERRGAPPALERMVEKIVEERLKKSATSS